MRLSICGLSQLGKRLQSDNPDIVISITDPESVHEADRALAGIGSAVHRMAFHEGNSWSMPRMRPVMTEDFEELEAFLDQNWKGVDTHLLVHCHAGMSRSPAMAMLALSYADSRIMGNEPNRQRAGLFAKMVVEQSPLCEPSDRIMGLYGLEMPSWREVYAPALLELVTKRNFETGSRNGSGPPRKKSWRERNWKGRR